MRIKALFIPLEKVTETVSQKTQKKKIRGTFSGERMQRIQVVLTTLVVVFSLFGLAALATAPVRVRAIGFQKVSPRPLHIHAVLLAASLLVLPNPGPVYAQEVGSDVVGEQIRQAAAILPGLGKPDVIYPAIYNGEWAVEQEVTGVVGDSSAKVVENAAAPVPVPELVAGLESASKVKFNRVYSTYNGGVILDRGVSTTRLLDALNPSARHLATFDPSNPNNCEYRTSDGKTVSFRVTKRSVEDMTQAVNGASFQDASKALGAVSYSEFSRVVENAEGGTLAPPHEWAIRILARYKATDENNIQGLERLFLYDASSPEQPIKVIKSRVAMKRLLQ